MSNSWDSSRSLFGAFFPVCLLVGFFPDTYKHDLDHLRAGGTRKWRPAFHLNRLKSCCAPGYLTREQFSFFMTSLVVEWKLLILETVSLIFFKLIISRPAVVSRNVLQGVDNVSSPEIKVNELSSSFVKLFHSRSYFACFPFDSSKRSDDADQYHLFIYLFIYFAPSYLTVITVVSFYFNK